MNLLAYFRSVTAKIFRRSEVAEELEAELVAHIQFRADDLERSGLPRPEAERRARIGLAASFESSRRRPRSDGRCFHVTALTQDLRLAVRACARIRDSPWPPF
jgi:hypothetical protein